jgi:hypothetical protein
VKHALYIAGAAFEFGGVMLAVLPDLVPGARRLSLWVAPRWRRLANRLRRMLHLPGRPIVVQVGPAGEVSLAGSASAIVTVGAGATPDERIEFLLRRDQERQQADAALGHRIDELDRDSQQRVEALSAGMQAHVAAKLSAADAEYRAARVLGAIALGVGLALATAGNFLN